MLLFERLVFRKLKGCEHLVCLVWEFRDSGVWGFRGSGVVGCRGLSCTSAVFTVAVIVVLAQGRIKHGSGSAVAVDIIIAYHDAMQRVELHMVEALDGIHTQVVLEKVYACLRDCSVRPSCLRSAFVSFLAAGVAFAPLLLC